MTKVEGVYESICKRLAERRTLVDGFEAELEVQIWALIKSVYAHPLRDVKKGGSIDWAMCDGCLTEVERGMHNRVIWPNGSKMSA